MVDFVTYDSINGIVDHTIGQKMRKSLDSLSFDGAVSDFVFYANNSRLLPAWWCQDRDVCLRKASIENDLISSTVNAMISLLYQIPFKVVPRDSMVLAHKKTADFYNAILQSSWINIAEKVYNDLLCQDKGAFIFIDSETGASDALISAPTGLRHLDSYRIILRNSDEHPYAYLNRANEKVLLHESRVIQLVQMPSPIYENATVGLSYVSRAYNVASLMKNITQYELEVLGGIDSSRVIWATGTSGSNLKQVFKDAQIDGIAQGKIHDADDVYLGMRDTSSKIGVLDLKRFPDGFKKNEYSESVIKLLALAGPVDSDLFMPTSSAGTTKTAALISDLKSKHKLPSWVANKVKNELDAKLLPPSLEIQIGEKRDELSETQAKTLINIARTEKIHTDSGTIDIRVSRENAVKNGIITQQQFIYLELDDGRLPDGLPVDSLFFKDEVTMKKLLDLPGFNDPCTISKNNPEDILPVIEDKICELKALTINSKSSQTHMNARSALAAMIWLKEQYNGPIQLPSSTVNNRDSMADNSSSQGDFGVVSEQSEAIDITDDFLQNTRRGRKLVKDSRRVVKRLWDNELSVEDAVDDLIKAIEDELEVELSNEVIDVIHDYLSSIGSRGVTKLKDIYSELNTTFKSL